MSGPNRRQVLSTISLGIASGIAGCSNTGSDGDGSGNEGKSGGDGAQTGAGGGTQTGGSFDPSGSASSSVDGLEVTNQRLVGVEGGQMTVELTIENVGDAETRFAQYNYELSVTPESAGLATTNTQYPNDTTPDGPGDDDADPPGDTGRVMVMRQVDADAVQSYTVTVDCNYGTPTPLQRGAYCQ